MPDIALRFAVSGTSSADANRLTTELQQWLKSRIEDIDLARIKEDNESQDAGTVLIATLAAPAVVEFAKGPALELAKGVADWLRKRRATVTIGADGSVTTENVKADDVERIVVETLKARQKS